MRAYEILQRYQHTQVDTEHLFLAMLEQSDGAASQILEKLNAPSQVIRAKLEEHLERSPKSGVGASYGGQVAQVFITPRLKRVIDVANEEASKLKDEYISTEHLFLGIAAERNSPTANILKDQGVTRERILHAVEELRGGQRVTDPAAETKYRMLERYGRDLTQLAREGKLDPVIGRDSEILRVIQ
ncbi:MAG TPA: Clp protease N-terminal domain-containing protein, partial [Anaerolineae bacterium]|nr:Clp protease N-terminal domain-containing protein [Anaerolineae bacterium]